MTDISKEVCEGNNKKKRRSGEMNLPNYGRWRVIGAPIKKGTCKVWMCICECGTIKYVNGLNLRLGKSISCGCARDEATIKRSTRHGLRNSKEYQAFCNMHQRCSNPNDGSFHDYGARGIVVCERWHDFSNFIEDMGFKPSPKHTIERVNVNQGYNPSNCIWADRKTQARNKRNNRKIIHKGIEVTLAQLSEETGIDRVTLLSRIKSGRSNEQLTTHKMHLKPDSWRKL